VFMISDRCLPVKSTTVWGAVVSCACQMSLLCYVQLQPWLTIKSSVLSTEHFAKGDQWQVAGRVCRAVLELIQVRRFERDNYAECSVLPVGSSRVLRRHIGHYVLYVVWSCVRIVPTCSTVRLVQDLPHWKRTAHSTYC